MGHFTGSHQITESRISEGRAKSQGRVFQRVVPNHRVAHFRGSRQITGSRISEGRAKSQGRVFHRVVPNHSTASFHGKSADHSMGPFPFFIVTLYTLTLHILHNLHCFHFSVSIFFVNFRTFFFSKDSILESNTQTH